MVAEGEKVVLYSTFTGAHTGSPGFIPYPATGEEISPTGVAAFIIADNKIIEEPWSNWDYSQVFDQTARACVRRLAEEVWSQGRLDFLDQIIHPDANPPQGTWELPGGPEGFKHLVSIIRTAFPDLTRKVVDIVVEGDKVVLYSTFTGTHTGTSDFPPFPPTGERWEMSGVTAFKFVDGKIFDEPWSRNDIPALMGRLAAATVRRLIDEALNKGNASIVDEVFARDAVSHTPNRDLRGHDEIKEPILMRRAAFPDLNVTIDKQVADGDNVVNYLTLSGTHVGDYRGVPATNRQVTWTQISIARFEKGRIGES